MATTQARLSDENRVLNASVQTLTAQAAAAQAVDPMAGGFDKWAALPRAAATTGQLATPQFHPNATFCHLVKPPHFHFGKQCCPEPFNDNAKGGFKDYALKMVNFIAMSAVNYSHVCAVLDWAAESDSPINDEECDLQARSGGWSGTGPSRTTRSSAPSCGVSSSTRPRETR